MAAEPVNLFDYEAIAKDRLSRGAYDFIAGGATDELSVRRNRAAFERIALRPSVLADISKVDSSTTVLGQRLPSPVMIAPAGAHALGHPDAELATARAAGAEGAVFAVSYHSSKEPGEIARAATGPLWFQMYLFDDRERTVAAARQARELGYSALCVTLDSRIGSKRERNMRNGFDPTGGGKRVLGGHGTTSTWDDLKRLAGMSTLPVVAKGIMTAADARLCIESGAKGIVVSNHGGRQLDTTLATVEVLPEVVAAVAGRAEVYLDGGIRRGSDVVKALALGARAVLIGRPVFWGLAAAGEAGVRGVLQMLRDETTMTMGACGRPAVDCLEQSLLVMTRDVTWVTI